MARILILTHEFLPFRGGIAAVAHGLATGAVSVGHEPIVFAPDYHEPAAHNDHAFEYQVVRFRGVRCRIVRPDHLIRFAVLCWRAIRRLKPDIVHAVDPPSQMALTALSRLRLIGRYYFTVHGSEALRYRDQFVPRVWMRHAFHRPAGVASVSEAALKLVRELGLPHEKGFVANPAIAKIWHEAPVRDPAAMRRSWGASDSDVVLITIARGVPDKGQRDVIAALGQLPASVRRRALYVIVGKVSNWYWQSLVDSAKRAGVRVLPLREVSDAEAVNAADAADLFVMPSRRTRTRLEGFGIAYIEAGARGLPSVARATGGTGEAVIDGVTGMVLPERAGTDALAAILRRLIEDREMRQRLGAAAKRFARDFTWERHATQVYEAFVNMR
jgi:glycosyltransferase involved in cell wall biosynthesis